MAAKKRILVIIEKTKTGFSAYSEDYPVYTTGSTISELIENANEAVSLYFEDKEKEIQQIYFEIDFKQFFQYYKVINSKALAEKIGMNPTLLSQYVRGHKKPSEKQSRRILYGINKIGQELAEMSVIYDSKSNESTGSMVQSLILDNMDKIKALCKIHNVRTLFAFGSVCTDKFNDKSDIDLLISFMPMDYGDYADTYFDLADKFENLFQRPVDLVTDKSLSNPYFIDSINQTKTLLYES